MQWLPWVLLFLGAALFWRDLWAAVKPRLARFVADCQAAGGAAKSALGGRLAMLLIGVVLGTFTPQVVGWVRANGWEWKWPNLPNIVVPSEGKRQAYIVRESETDSPEFGILANQLRNGVNADYLKTKGHTLTIHDDDDVTADGQSPAVLSANKPFSGVELLIYDGDKLLKREACPSTANGVIEAIKRSGG